jgi:redox-sensitive bicupin YhaK (pirin superfamily)
MGVDISGNGSLHLPLDPTFEYGLAVLHGAVRIAEATVAPNQFLYLGTGRDECEAVLAAGSRFLLLGGQPFAEEIVMWWNFVARTRTELEDARGDWEGRDPRFGVVQSTLRRIEAPHPFWSR